MDNRYSLLKDAMVRNIKEYNDKFKPATKSENTFLPYIILVVDEFAD
jgi:S-DNA-T family DNA segregation ATPase FtsK/SpoIIIE